MLDRRDRAQVVFAIESGDSIQYAHELSTPTNVSLICISRRRERASARVNLRIRTCINIKVVPSLYWLAASEAICQSIRTLVLIVLVIMCLPSEQTWCDIALGNSCSRSTAEFTELTAVLHLSSEGRSAG